MFDTHCHLNFKAFDNRVRQAIEEAKTTGVKHLVVPGTDVKTSKKAVDIACRFENVYAAVGIHPHHVKGYRNKTKDYHDNLQLIETLLKNEKVVAIGEVGLDGYFYRKTKYQNYQVDDGFINLQKVILEKQIALAKRYNKALIIHNRQARSHLINLLNETKTLLNPNRVVFHCCEPEEELLSFAKNERIFIGVDGDITYRSKKTRIHQKGPFRSFDFRNRLTFFAPSTFKRQKTIS